MISDTLVKVAAKGVGFLTAQTFLKKFLGIARSIILARLLSPTDFGLISLAMVLIQGMNSLTSVGIDKYLIQKQSLDTDIIGNAWLLNMIRGFLLTLLALAFCPLYSKLVHEPKTLELLQIIAFIPFVEGLKNPSSILAEREIRFGLISTYETICAILEVTVVVILAWFIRDVKALAWGLIFSIFLKTLLSFVIFSIPAIPKFKISCQRDMLSVAKHFAVISAGTLIMVQGDNLIVGAMIGSDKLGLYVIAYQLSVFPVALLQQIANRIALPIFSSLQVEKKRLREVVGHVMQIQLAVIIPFVIAVGIFARNIIITLYSDKWIDAVPVLQCLMLVTLGKGLTHVCVPYIIGTGAFGFASRMKFCETIFFLAGVYMGTRYFGLTGAALGAGTGYMIAGMGRMIFMCRENNIALTRAAFYSFLPVISVIPGVLIAMCLVKVFAWHQNIETIAALIIVSVSYVGISFIVQKNLVEILIRKTGMNRYYRKKK